MNLTDKIKSLVVSDSLEWYFFPNSFIAKLNTERLILQLEVNQEKENDVEKILNELHLIKNDISDILNISRGNNLIFDIDLTDKNDKKTIQKLIMIYPLQLKAYELFKQLNILLDDNKIFDYCP